MTHTLDTIFGGNDFPSEYASICLMDLQRSRKENLLNDPMRKDADIGRVFKFVR